MTSPYSVRRPRRWLIWAVRNFTNCWRMRCSARIACCSSVLIATVLMPGCCTAVQIARASCASFLLPPTKGRTIFAGSSRTSWPSSRSRRPQCCEPPHASSATRHGTRLAKCWRNFVHVSRKSTISPVFTRFAVSTPTTVLLIFTSDPPVCLGRHRIFPLGNLDAVGPWGSTSTLPTADIRGGRRPFHSPARGALPWATRTRLHRCPWHNFPPPRLYIIPPPLTAPAIDQFHSRRTSSATGNRFVQQCKPRGSHLHVPLPVRQAHQLAEASNQCPLACVAWSPSRRLQTTALSR